MTGAGTPGSLSMGTCWHITIAAYGARLHGDDRPTVDRDHNKFGTAFLGPDANRNRHEHEIMGATAVVFSLEQREFIESTVPELCVRGGWRHITCAAPPDHVHVLIEADPKVHGKRIRPLLKRWLTQALDAKWAMPKRQDGSSWWGEGGSNRAVNEPEYFDNAFRYINEQRATRKSAG